MNTLLNITRKIGPVGDEADDGPSAKVELQDSAGKEALLRKVLQVSAQCGSKDLSGVQEAKRLLQGSILLRDPRPQIRVCTAVLTGTEGSTTLCLQSVTTATDSDDFEGRQLETLPQAAACKAQQPKACGILDFLI